MFFYFAMLLVPALTSLAPYRLDPGSRRVVYALTGALMIFIVGFREHIGFDWNNYLRIFYATESKSLSEAVLSTEPGYSLINWICAQMGWQIYGVNFFCSIISVTGLIAFLRRQPSFWRALALTMPVLIIGVCMSATRQACAIGFLMLAFNAFQDKKLIRYVVLVTLAVTFHRSSFVFLLLVPFMNERFKIWHLALAGAAFFLISIFLTRDSLTYYQGSYVNSEIVSSGALPRVGMNVLAGVLFFIFRKKWIEEYDDGNFFTLACGLMIMMAVGVFNAQTAVDRMEMYLIPVQCAVMARIPQFFKPGIIRTQIIIGIFGLYAAILAVWLAYSPFTKLTWIPYQNILLM